MEIRTMDAQDASRLLPERDKWAHKGDFGRILLRCGSRGFTGAAYLAAMGALRTGAGLVFLGVPEGIYAIEAGKLAEPVVFPLPEEHGMLSEDALTGIMERLPGMDGVLIGCGLGQSPGTLAVTRAVLESAKCPVVVDADGLNLLAGHKDILRGRHQPTILTPHGGEFARMFGGFDGSPMEAAAAAAADVGGIILLKGHETCVTDGARGCLNRTGNPGMAVGGSGDVLAGVITSLLGQGVPPLEAAALGAWLHGAAGDLCAQEIGQYGMLPSDLIARLPRLLR